MFRKLHIFVLLLVLCFVQQAFSYDKLIFEDTFSGTTGGDITGHTPDTGTGWTEVEDTAGDKTYTIHATNQLSISANGTDNRLLYTASPTPGTANSAVEFSLAPGSSQICNNNVAYTHYASPAVMLRYKDTSNYYVFIVYGNNSSTFTMRIGKVVGGTRTSLVTQTFTAATNDVIRAEVVGDMLKMYQNGTEILSVTDTDITGTGNAGIAYGTTIISADDTHTQCKMDNYKIYEIRRRMW